MSDNWFVDVTCLGSSVREVVDLRTPKAQPQKLPRPVYTVVEELRRENPSDDDATCWCGKPATIPTQWDGCKYCGGGDCGDFPYVDWICQTCFYGGDEA